MTIKEAKEQLIKEFNEYVDWEEKYAAIIKMGKEMPPFPEEYRIEKNKIHGCQSQVWMNARLDGDKVIIEAESDAMIVKGLIAMLIKVYSNQSPKEILNNPPDFVKKIGIDSHLSPTRKNGLGAMLKQIQMYALAFSTIVK
jgi:cysteine desulfuration protein SufE